MDTIYIVEDETIAQDFSKKSKLQIYFLPAE